VSCNITEHFTQPPRQFTEDTLLSVMNSAGSDEITEDVERSGLGTPATRAAIIEKLIKSGFVKRDKKNLVITESGAELIELMPESVKSASMTAEWENTLAKIAKGEYSDEEFMANISDFISAIISTAKNNVNPEKVAETDYKGEKIGSCPRCGANVIDSHNPKFNAYACTAEKEKCGFILWKSVAQKTLTESQVKQLLEKKKTSLIKGFKSKTGNDFDAVLVLKSDFTVGFEFQNKK